MNKSIKKTNVLITCGALSIGGVEKSLINLLKSINYDKYNIQLMLPTKKGDLIREIDKNVEIIISPPIITVPTFRKNGLGTDFKYLKNRIHEIPYYLICANIAFLKNSKLAKQKYWDLVQKKINVFNQQYDIAISFAGGIGIWNQYIIDKIEAEKKICWIHGDYAVFGTQTAKEKEYFRKFDTVVAVSKSVKSILVKEIPELCDKIEVIHNIIDVNYINKLSGEYIDNDDFIGIRFVSISRLDKGKGFDLAIRAFHKVINEGYDIRWDIIGDGNEMENLTKLVRDLNLIGKVRLLGKLINPYPYLKKADVFLHPSKGEGKSISVDEAKILSKPILITDYPTVKDQIEDNVTGRIVPISIDGLYEGFIELTTNYELRNKLHRNLLSIDYSKDSIYKFYNIVSVEEKGVVDEN